MTQLNCIHCGEQISRDRDFGVYAKGKELRVSHLECFFEKAKKLSFFRKFNVGMLTLSSPDEKKLKSTRIFVSAALASIAGVYMLMAYFSGLLDAVLVTAMIGILVLVIGAYSWLMNRSFRRLKAKWDFVEKHLGSEEEA